VPKNLTAGHEVQRIIPFLVHLIYYANQWEHFLKHAVTGSTTWIVRDPIPPHPKKKKKKKRKTQSFKILN